MVSVQTDPAISRARGGDGEKRCPLEYTAGRVEICPGKKCPFWEEDGQAVGGGCALERLGLRLDGNRELVIWLLRIRKQLSEAAAEGEEEQARLLHVLEPPGLRD